MEDVSSSFCMEITLLSGSGKRIIEGMRTGSRGCRDFGAPELRYWKRKEKGDGTLPPVFR